MTKTSPAPLPAIDDPPVIIGMAVALSAVAASTLIGVMLVRGWGAGSVVLLYIPAVLATATYCGSRPALVAAGTASLAYNFFFTAPYHTLWIDSPDDVVTVFVLFTVALATSRLASGLRDQARLAAAHARRNATIAGFARRLIAAHEDKDIAEVGVTQLASLFACNAALLKDSDGLALIASSPHGLWLSPNDLVAAHTAMRTGEAAGRGFSRPRFADWQFRPVISGQEVIVVVGLARDDGALPVPEAQSALLGNLLDQLALALDRARLEREAQQASAIRERDKIRTALLASIGEDVKPRLNTISAAARALRRAGTADRSVVGEIAAEAVKLQRYIDDLVDLSPAADREPIVVGPLAIDVFERSVRRNGEEIHLTPKEFAVLSELAKHLGEVLTHRRLLRVVWGPAHENQIDYLRVAIRALRQKLEPDPGRPTLILNEPAVGYRLRPASAQAEAQATTPAM